MRTGSFELPIGLLSITMALFSIAVVNLFTKQVATVSGIAFTLALYVVFAISERTAARLFHDYEQMPFTKSVAVAEREGRPARDSMAGVGRLVDQQAMLRRRGAYRLIRTERTISWNVPS